MQRTVCLFVALLAASSSCASATRALRKHAEMDSGSFSRGGTNMRMQPEVVATTLSKVEDEWRYQYRLFLQCNASASTRSQAEKCLMATKAFKQSCATVVSAVVKASSGDRNAVHEYMADVCSEPELKGWHAAQCEVLAATVLSGMSQDDYDNRENMAAGQLCTNFWSRFTQEEDAVIRQQEDERLAREKAEAEARAAEEKREAEERLVREKAEEEAREAEAKKAKEEAAEKERVREEEEAREKALEASAERAAEEEFKREEEAAASQAKQTAAANATNATSAANASRQQTPANASQQQSATASSGAASGSRAAATDATAASAPAVVSNATATSNATAATTSAAASKNTTAAGSQKANASSNASSNVSKKP